MTPSLPPGEPAAGPWRAAPLSAAVHVVTTAAGAPAGRPRAVATGGRSGSGGSTLAERRGLDRDVASGATGNRDRAAACWRGWTVEEVPVLEDQRPWKPRQPRRRAGGTVGH